MSPSVAPVRRSGSIARRNARSRAVVTTSSVLRPTLSRLPGNTAATAIARSPNCCGMFRGPTLPTASAICERFRRWKMLWGGGVDIASIVRCEPMELPMQTLNNLSRSLIALEPASTLIAVIEMSLSSWLVAGIVPGIERQPLKKLAVDERALLRPLHRWREEAGKRGWRVERIVVAFEAGRDGFWLARWLKARSIEAHVIHAASVAVSRQHRRAQTHPLDAELLKRAFLGWLRGE